jgi:hypothetical protein
MTAAANGIRAVSGCLIGVPLPGFERYTHHGSCFGGSASHKSHLAPNSATGGGNIPPW